MLNTYFRDSLNLSHPPITPIDSGYQSSPCCVDILCSMVEVSNFLTRLDSTKANGQDGISARML